jgi:HD-GYP domain-containing protein (c-di-GMP phosphodiesterase class II)
MSEDSEVDGAVATAPPPAPPVSRGLIVAYWLSDASRQRITDACPVEISEDNRRARDADLIVVSTRVPRGRSVGLVEELREVTNAPIVVVCHAGGEAVAIEIMQAGAAAIVGEGNEQGLRSFLGFADAEESLTSSYEKRVDRYKAGDASSRGRDEVTNLPGSSSFELRLAELSQGGVLPRVGFVEIINMEAVIRGMDREALRLLRRRLSLLLADIARRVNAELFTIDEARYALLSSGLSIKDAFELGREMAEVTATFAPMNSEMLQMAMGHAGPEVASDVRIARELAERALEAARGVEGGGTVSADELSKSLASSTELEAALKLAAHVDETDGYPGSHSSRVADYAGELAKQLGYDGQEFIRIRLAAMLHDIGKVGLPAGAMMEPPDDGDPEMIDRFQQHSVRSDRYAKVSAGPEVSKAIRSHHERWDGNGYPDGLAGEEIPLGARIIAVADAYDSWSNPISGPVTRKAFTMSEVVAKLQEEAGSRFDPMVVRAALELFGAG